MFIGKINFLFGTVTISVYIVHNCSKYLYMVIILMLYYNLVFFVNIHIFNIQVFKYLNISLDIILYSRCVRPLYQYDVIVVVHCYEGYYLFENRLFFIVTRDIENEKYSTIKVCITPNCF